jgi:hypothetical protein
VCPVLDASYSSFPDVATDGAGGWTIAWQQGGYSRISVSASRDDGMTWGEPTALDTGSAVGAFDADVRLASDGAATVAVWWRGGLTSADIRAATSFDGGVSWTLPTDITTDVALDQYPALATDGRGTWGALWRSGEHALRWASSTDAGRTWSAPQVVNSTPGTIDPRRPALAVDGRGTWTAAWAVSGVVGPDFDVLYMSSTDAGVTWTAPRAAYGDANRDDQRTDRSPALAGLPRFVLLARNAFSRDANGTIASDIAVTRLKSAGP